MRVPLLYGTQPLVVKHGITEPEITRVQHRAHLTLEEKHDGTGAMEGVHEHDLHAIFPFLIQIDPVLFVHLQVYHIVAQVLKAISDQLLRQVAAVDFAMVPIIAQAAQVILVTMAQEIAVPCLVLRPILKVVDSNVRISDVTHFF